jgi:YVTN family beta-propeller protein
VSFDASSSPELPSGTVTFLFTDIEGSTRLLKQLRERYADALTDHQRILRAAFSEHDGREIDTQGDSFFVAFRRTKDAVGAAVAGQLALSGHDWPDGSELRVRMGIHTGEPAVGDERYIGLGVHRAARICAAGAGGQVLVSQTTRELLRDDPLPDVSLRDLGEHQLKDLDEPERIYQLLAPGLQESFGPLKTAAPTPFEGREGELAEAAAQELAGPWWRQRRPLLAVALVAVAIAAALGVLLTRGDGTASASRDVAANAIGVIDPTSGKILSQIAVGVAPGGVAASKNAIWVTNADDHSVSHVDPETNDVRDTIQVGGGPAGLAVDGGGDVWVANGLDGTVSRINGTANRVVQTVTVGNGPSGVAYGEGAIWVANAADGTVTRVDPEVGRVTKTVPVAVGVSGIAVGFGRVWVVSASEGRVLALDPRTGRVEERIGVGVDPAAIAAGPDAIWVANRGDGTVSKINPRANQVTRTITVGNGPDGVAVGASGVWVSNGKDGTLSLVDPDREAVVRTVELANPPQGLAVTQQGVYVAVRSSGAAHREGTLSVAGWTDFSPDSIDPAVGGNPTSWPFLITTNDGLVGFRRVGGIEGIQLVPDLAVSLPTPTDDGRTYTFRLRPGIRYSNGSLVEPEDFRWAIERGFEMNGPTYYGGIDGAGPCRAGRQCDLSRGIVTDGVARTVTIRLTAPDAEFLHKLALPEAFVIPAGTPARDVGSHPVPATGPYMIAAYRKGRYLRLERNPAFHEWSADAQPNGYPDAIVWRFGSSGSGAMRTVERGAADYALVVARALPKAQLELIATRYPSQLHVGTGPLTSHFFLNVRVPPFDDVRVRRAVNIAFDRDTFVRRTGSSLVAAPTCQLLPPSSAAFRPYCPYGAGGAASVDAARRLVRSSGTVGAQVVVWVPSPLAAQGRYMASVLESLGYRARVKAVPPDAYFQKVLVPKTSAQVGYYSWGATYPSAASFLQEQFTCGASLGNFCNQRIDAAIDRASAVQAHDPPAAGPLWQQVERDILAQAPVVPTSNPRNVDFVSKRLGNYQYHPQWGFLIAQAWVK